MSLAVYWNPSGFLEGDIKSVSPVLAFVPMCLHFHVIVPIDPGKLDGLIPVRCQADLV